TVRSSTLSIACVLSSEIYSSSIRPNVFSDCGKNTFPARLAAHMSNPLSGARASCIRRFSANTDWRSEMTQTVARLLAESFEAHDVDQVYCVPGESYVGLTSALIEKNSIRVIVCRHESGAGFMAVADGRLRDRAGVALVSRGPGLSNAMVALHSAYHDATPVVMLIGQVERRDFGRLALQEQNYSRLLS